MTMFVVQNGTDSTPSRTGEDYATGKTGIQDGQQAHTAILLPRPLGVMAVGDGLAITLMRQLLDRGIRIPEDISVVGVDNSELECEAADVPLTSVNTNANQIGYVAAARLDRLMAGERPAPGTVLIPPVAVVARASTDSVRLVTCH